MNDIYPWGFRNSLDQEPDGASLTMNLEETVPFGYRERSLQTYSTIVVVDPQEVYARSAWLV